MLDDLREQAETGTFFDELEEEIETDASPSPLSQEVFLGMTSLQRFIIAIMLLLVSCLFSALCLLATGKIVPPFLY